MYKLIKTFFPLLVVGCISWQTVAASDSTATRIQASEAQQLIEQAASKYAGRNYTDAVNLYERVIKEYGRSAEVHYNLGNAYYKSDRITSAILNYERALKLSPGDEDIRFNLRLCQTKIVDQITPVGKFLLVRWYESFGQLTGSNGWAWISILSFLLFITCLLAYFLARRRWLKKTSFFVGLLAITMTSLAFSYSYQAKQQQLNSDQAIVFALSVTAKSTPDQSGTDLFVLHEGTKVLIKSRLSDWFEIELSDGNIGWLPSSDLVII